MPMGFLPIYGIILPVVCSFSLLLPSASSDSRLLPNRPLTVGSTLISDDGIFALGFFSPSNSTRNNYYVGIWYNQIPKDNIVWVANRATPITDPSSATLALTNTSNLVVSGTDGQLLWTANVSAPGNTISGEATLDNTGNFILRTSEGVILWQSFDYPTDTVLIGMNFRVTHSTHALQKLISWKGPQDPSPGSFSFSADPNEFLQRFVWNGSRPYWRGPVLNNYLLYGSYMEIMKFTLYLIIRRIDDEIYISFGTTGDSSSSPVKIKMDYSGKLKFLIWKSNMLEWNALLAEPNYKCNTYGYCGPFGYCDNTEPIVACKCLDGFEPISNTDRSDGRSSEGCRRKEALRCDRGNSFLTLTDMKIPDKFMYVKNRSFDECTEDCASNCYCTAYAYANMSTTAINGDETRCLLWMGDLIDTQKLTVNGENLYIRVNSLSDEKRSHILKITLPVVLSFLILICMCLLWICTCRAKQRNKQTWKEMISGGLSASDELVDEKFPFISFREIVLATNNFSSPNMLGHGGFGYVYKIPQKDHCFNGQ